MEDVDRPVVGCREEEGVNGREGDGTERARVVSERFVGRGGKVEVVPDETFIVRTDDEIVCNARDFNYEGGREEKGTTDLQGGERRDLRSI